MWAHKAFHGLICGRQQRVKLRTKSSNDAMSPVFLQQPTADLPSPRPLAEHYQRGCRSCQYESGERGLLAG